MTHLTFSNGAHTATSKGECNTPKRIEVAILIPVHRTNEAKKEEQEEEGRKQTGKQAWKPSKCHSKFSSEKCLHIRMTFVLRRQMFDMSVVTCARHAKYTNGFLVLHTWGKEKY